MTSASGSGGATSPSVFAAVDLGASSGRVVIGRVTPNSLTLNEVHRFANGPVRLHNGLHWDINGLFREIVVGLRAAAEFAPSSIGVDSWAVDYGLLDEADALVEQPFHHRDDRTKAVAPRVVDELGAAHLYSINGLQFLPFNTMFQLAAARGTPSLSAARTMLLIPDLIVFWLTGRKGAEITNASTTGLLDATSHTWSSTLAASVGLSDGMLPELHEPGTRIGDLLPELTAETGLIGPPNVTAVASHDTASAVLAVPARTNEFAYISTGTWSLAGLELPAPVLSEKARAANFTNEAGIDGTTRFLRNIMGLWLVQESLRAWGSPASALPGLLADAADSPPFASIIDAHDARFLPPGDMPERIVDYCLETGQEPPRGRAAVLRCIIESLALAHRQAIREAAELADRDIRVVHLVGGGVHNELLCQLTADAIGLPVNAGPVEATAIGNLLVQARAAGTIGDLSSLRELTAATQPIRRYEPHGDSRSWDAVEARIAVVG